MDGVDLQSALATFEEKIDIKDLILPSKTTKMGEIKIFAVKYTI